MRFTHLPPAYPLLIRILLGLFCLLTAAGFAAFGGPAQTAHAATNITVTTTADNTTHDGLCSLREALSLANWPPVNDDCGGDSYTPYTITIPAGTYTLNSELPVGDGYITIHLVGAGQGLTTIKQGSAGCSGSRTQRVFNIGDPTSSDVVVTISDMTISNGAGQGIGGGAILFGGLNHSLTLNNVTIADNCAYGTSKGGGLAFWNEGYLTINNSTFSNNTVYTQSGGAIHFQTLKLGSSLLINGSTFIDNSSYLGNGGAIYLDGYDAQLDINGSTFKSNHAYQGGAIYIDDGTVNLGNTAANSLVDNYANIVSTGAVGMVGGILNGSNNWWGCNQGPNSTDCDKASLKPGFSSVTPWVVLKTSAEPNPIYAAQTATFSASFRQNSAGGDLTATQMGALSGKFVSWDIPPFGYIESIQYSIQANGVATATIRHLGKSCDPGIVNARVDKVGFDDPLATATLSITCAEMRCGGTGTYTFRSQSSVVIDLTNAGSNLGCLLVDETDVDHPYATGTSGGSGTKTGKYWTITALQSDGITPASQDFTLSLTLPHSLVPDSAAQVCQYTGTDLTWSCVRSSSTDTSVTRQGIQDLSDWAVGYQVGPNPVEVIQLQTRRSQVNAWAAAGLIMICLSLIIRRAVIKYFS